MRRTVDERQMDMFIQRALTASTSDGVLFDLGVVSTPYTPIVRDGVVIAAKDRDGNYLWGYEALLKWEQDAD